MLKSGNAATDGGKKSDGNISKKRVRFLDKSVAQELILREKTRLEDRIQALRQKYNFSKENEDDSDDDDHKRDTGNQIDIVPRGLLKSDRRPKSSVGFRTKQDMKGSAGNTEARTRRSYSLSRLDELAKPRGRSKSVQPVKKSTMIMLSPDHLRLTIPQKSPRTINQLKDLPADELDYLLQPKSLKEFYAMADMCSSPSRTSSRASSAFSGRGNPSHRTQSAGSSRSRNTKVAPAATETVPPPAPPPIKPKFKPSLKMAATGVISMTDKPKSSQQQDSTSAAMQSWTKALSIRSPNIVTGRYQMPGGRVLRLRPRKPAWEDETSVKDNQDPSSANSTEEGDSAKDTKMNTVSDQVTPRKVDSRNGKLRYRVRQDSRSLHVSELTKDLTKCKYLRSREQDQVLDIDDIFKK